MSVLKEKKCIQDIFFTLQNGHVALCWFLLGIIIGPSSHVKKSFCEQTTKGPFTDLTAKNGLDPLKVVQYA